MNFIEHMNSLRNYKAEEIIKIAEITKSTRSAVYMWMSGKANVPKIKQEIIAKHLGKTVEELWPDEENKE